MQVHVSCEMTCATVKQSVLSQRLPNKGSYRQFRVSAVSHELR